MEYFMLLVIAIRDLIPWIVIGGIFAWVGALVLGLRYLKTREIRWRKTLEPLCTWEYSPAAWPQIAERYGLAVIPKGTASVKITKLDIWIADESCDRRNELDGDRRCVTGCAYANGIFKIRIRSWAIPTRSALRIDTKVDLRLPVPVGHEQAAQAAVAYFIETIGKQAKKIAGVAPENVFVGAFGETDL